MAAGLPLVDNAYKEAIKAASADIQELIKREHCTPMLIRLAFHDALTYDAATNTSGANGSIRFVPSGWRTRPSNLPRHRGIWPRCDLLSACSTGTRRSWRTLATRACT